MSDVKFVRSDECLQVFLPEELREGSPTGFAMTGHIGACILASCRILRS